MTKQVFNTLLAKQMSDEEKRKRADFLIDTSSGLDQARVEVNSLIQRLTGGKNA